MKREIKFRGQNIKGQWNYGLLTHDKNKDSDYEWFISNSAGKPYAFGAIEKTVGQFTGLKDKNGVDIYEGDIVKPFLNDNTIAEIIFMDASFKIATKRTDNGNYMIWNYFQEEIEVIGSIHSNPELIK